MNIDCEHANFINGNNCLGSRPRTSTQRRREVDSCYSKGEYHHKVLTSPTMYLGQNQNSYPQPLNIKTHLESHYRLTNVKQSDQHFSSERFTNQQHSQEHTNKPDVLDDRLNRSSQMSPYQYKNLRFKNLQQIRKAMNSVREMFLKKIQEKQQSKQQKNNRRPFSAIRRPVSQRQETLTIKFDSNETISSPINRFSTKNSTYLGLVLYSNTPQYITLNNKTNQQRQLNNVLIVKPKQLCNERKQPNFFKAVKAHYKRPGKSPNQTTNQQFLNTYTNQVFVSEPQEYGPWKQDTQETNIMSLRPYSPLIQQQKRGFL